MLLAAHYFSFECDFMFRVWALCFSIFFLAGFASPHNFPLRLAYGHIVATFDVANMHARVAFYQAPTCSGPTFSPPCLACISVLVSYIVIITCFPMVSFRNLPVRQEPASVIFVILRLVLLQSWLCGLVFVFLYLFGLFFFICVE